MDLLGRYHYTLHLHDNPRGIGLTNDIVPDRVFRALLQKHLSEVLRNLPEQAAIALSLERAVELLEAEHLDVPSNFIANFRINNRGE